MKKLLLFILLVCSLFMNSQVFSQSAPPVPNNYINSTSAGANTNGLKQLIDCSRPGMSILTVDVNAGASATVVVNAIGTNPDGTPNMGYIIQVYTLLSTASGPARLLIPHTATAFYQISSSTTGVALTYIASCR